MAANLEETETPKNESSIQYSAPVALTNLSLQLLFDLPDFLQIKEKIGSGAYGVVVSAFNASSDEFIAIKRIGEVFSHTRLAKQTLRELKLMRLLEHDSILRLLSAHVPSSMSEIYLFSELMDQDLLSSIRSPCGFLSRDNCRLIMFQVLKGLHYLHSVGVVHRDLKPSNILINSDCEVRICDFGLARMYHSNLKPKAMTDHVASLWYRAPELLLASKHYTHAMDIWSAGTIFAEMLGQKPLFAGTNNNHQLDLIFNVNGTPTKEDVDKVPHPRAREKLRRMTARKPTGFEKYLKADDLALDLLRKMLAFCPHKRISATQALLHPFFEGLQWDQREFTPICNQEFSFESMDLDITEIKDLVLQEILLHSFQKEDKFKEMCE